MFSPKIIPHLIPPLFHHLPALIREEDDVQSTPTLPCGSDLKVYFPLFMPHPTIPHSFHCLEMNWMYNPLLTALYGSVRSKSLSQHQNVSSKLFK